MLKNKFLSNKIFYVLSFIFLIVISVIIYFNSKDTYAVDINKTFTRKELQNMVVSTALSYFYNREYTDYEQYSMDEKQGSPYQYASFYWRNANVTPEEVNRTNRFNITCSGFSLITYLYSLGYDMSEYYNRYNYTYFEKFEWKNSNESKESYIKSSLQHGKGWWTEELASIADYVSGNNGKTGEEYINNSLDNKTEVVYYYKVKALDSNGNYSETTSEQEAIEQNILSILQPGDILVYRRKNKSTGILAGHCLIYIGDNLTIGEHGFLHSTGIDFNINNNPITIGDDSFSILYDTWENKIRSNIFITGAKSTAVSFSILRPINTYCDSDKDSSVECTLTVDSNVIARNELSRLRVEQYQSNSNGNFSVYNSVNTGENVTYNLVLTNKSKFNYCFNGAPSYSTQDKCESGGFEWKETTQEEITYNNLKVTAKVPTGTSYVSCTNNCTYDSSTKTVSWNVASITPSNYKELTYTVKITGDDSIVNSGFLITTANNNKLQLGELTLKINPTLNSSSNKNSIKSNIENFSTLVDNGKINFSSSTGNFKVDLDNVSSASMSNLDFVKSIYYNSLGVDLNYLTITNMKNALFNNKSGTGYNVFAKKTENEISNLTNNNYININKMLVSGMYGGRLLKGNDNGDRARYLRTSYLQYGDIIFTFEEDATKINAYIFCGFKENSAVLVEFNKNSSGDSEVIIYDGYNSTKTGYRLFKEIFAKDLFFVLRPTKLYGTIVNYNYNGGSGSGKLYVAYDTYKNLITPTKSAFVVTLDYNGGNTSGMPSTKNATNEFVNWYSDSDFTSKITNSSKLSTTNTHTIYAKWQTNSVNLPTPTRNGYKFLGWYNSSDVKVSNEYIPSKNVTLSAKWEKEEYSITYKLNGGTNSENNPSSYTYGDEVTFSNPTKTGYTFLGWYTESTFTNKITKISSTTYGNKTLYAKWEASQYDIVYNLNGGTNNKNNPSSYVYGNDVELLSPSRIGYKFIGWYTNKNLTSKIEKISSITTGTVTLYAKWEEADYTITYKLDGGTNNKSNPTAYSYGEEVILGNASKVGYTFVGWYTDPEFTDKIEKINKTDYGDFILYAKFTINKYTITFDSNGGSLVEPLTADYGTKIIKPDNPIKEGYVFVGWFSDEELTKLYTLSTMPSDDITLHAKWILEGYTITYNLDGGINNENNKVDYMYGDEFELLSPSKIGYKFIGWYTDSEFTTEIKKINVTDTGDIILYAKWEKEIYIITYNLDGGINNEKNPVSYTYGDEIVLLDPVRDGYKFVGWYTDSDFVNSIDVINKDDVNDITLYANWEQIVHDNDKTNDELEDNSKTGSIGQILVVLIGMLSLIGVLYYFRKKNEIIN